MENKEELKLIEVAEKLSYKVLKVAYSCSYNKELTRAVERKE